MSILYEPLLRRFLLLTACFVGCLATIDIDVPYNDLTYLPSKDAWVDYPDPSCPHIASNANDAAVQYTFTGSAVAFYLPKATNGANATITFSDGTTWYHDTFGEGCDAFYRLTFPEYQYKPLTVTIRPTGGLYLNVQKFVITTLTVEEQSSLASFSSVSTARMTGLPATSAITSASITSSRVTSSQALQSSGVGSAAGTDGQTQSKSSSNTAGLVGGILGGVLGGVLITILVFMLLRRRKRRQQAGPKTDLDTLDTMPSPWVAQDRARLAGQSMGSNTPMAYPQHALYPITPGTQPSEFSYSSGVGTDAPPPEYTGPSTSNHGPPGMRQLPIHPTSSLVPPGMSEKKVAMSTPSTPSRPF